MKRWFLIVMVCLSLTLAAGCDNTTPAQRVATAKAMLVTTTAVSQQIDSSVGQLKVAIETSKAMLADPNIPADMKAQALANLNMAQSKLDSFLAAKAKLDALLVQETAIINSVDLNNVTAGTEVSTYGQALSAIAPMIPAPYSSYFYLLTAFGIPAIGWLITQIKNGNLNKALNDTKGAFTNTVTSVNELLDPANGVVTQDKVQPAIDVLKGAQLPATRAAVDAILDPMQNTGPTN